MRGLVVFFVIAYTSLVSGAPTDDEHKIISKTFNYTNKDVIYAKIPFSKDQLVYAVCEGSDPVKKCKVYVDSLNQDTVQSCDLDLEYHGRFDHDVDLFNAGNSKAVFAVRDRPGIKMISVNLNDCQIGEARIDLPVKFTGEAELPLQVVVIAHENNYDVVYHNMDLCHNSLCKTTFDYKGKVVKATTDFLVPDVQSLFYGIEFLKNTYIVTETHSAATYVHLVHENATKAHRLYAGPQGPVSASAEENKLGFCLYVYHWLVCNQYDSEGQTKINEVQVLTPFMTVQYLDVLNLEKGLLAALVTYDGATNRRATFVIHFDEKGRYNGKFVEVDLKCDVPKFPLPKLYKNSKGEYCVTSLCLGYLDNWENHSVFSRNTRCFHEAELF